MDYIVAVNDFYGKTSPPFDEDIIVNGNVIIAKGQRISQDEFCRPVKQQLIAALQRNGLGAVDINPLQINEDVYIRHKRAQQSNADLLINIDLDVFGSAFNSVCGFSTYFSVFNKFTHESLRLASLINLYMDFKKHKQKNRDIKTMNTYLLREPQMPSVLLRAGYLTCKNEARRMLEPDFQQDTAEAVAKAIVKFFEKEYIPLPDDRTDEDKEQMQIIKLTSPITENNMIKTVQQALSKANFYQGEIDGRYGVGTALAIRMFQRSRKLPESGIIDTATLNALIIEKLCENY